MVSADPPDAMIRSDVDVSRGAVTCTVPVNARRSSLTQVNRYRGRLRGVTAEKAAPPAAPVAGPDREPAIGDVRFDDDRTSLRFDLDRLGVALQQGHVGGASDFQLVKRRQVVAFQCR